MWPERVSHPGPLTYESGGLPTALRGPASHKRIGGTDGCSPNACNNGICSILKERFSMKT